MSQSDFSPLEICPDCGLKAPLSPVGTHRYLGASSGCWNLYSNMLNGGSPPLPPGPLNVLLVDAYASQHHGLPGPQAIQSVAVHLLTMYGIFERGHTVDQALWLRRRFLRDGPIPKHDRFEWLTPPADLSRRTILEIINAPTPAERGPIVEAYVNAVYDAWHGAHGSKLREWYERYM
ncbi:MAG: DUF5946 family protein [Chloroflexota bacterium]